MGFEWLEPEGHRFSIEGGLGVEGGVPAEAGQVVIARVPNPEVVAVVAPGGFVGMNDVQGADFVEQVGVAGQSAAGGLALEAKSAGGNQPQAEEVGEKLAALTVGDVEVVTQVKGGSFGRRPDVNALQSVASCFFSPLESLHPCRWWQFCSASGRWPTD